jgi:hypothetical protein
MDSFGDLYTLASHHKTIDPSTSVNDSLITKNATKYFDQMRSGNFSIIYNDLPEVVKKNTSIKSIQNEWNEATKVAGGLPKDNKSKVSCYRLDHSRQIRVEFIIQCEKGDFKVFINYDSNGNLYNYVIWKNS